MTSLLLAVLGEWPITLQSPGGAFAAMALLKGFDTEFSLGGGGDSRSPDPYPKHSALELSTQVSVLVLNHVHAGKSPDVFGLWFPHR